MSAVIKDVELLLRPMSQNDLVSISAIEGENYQFPWTENIFRDCLRVGYSCRVLDTEGSIAGYAILSTAVDEAHLLNLCIRSELQGAGLGSYLLQHMINLANEARMSKIILEVRVSNPVAQKLYRKAGFRMIGLRQDYYRAVNGREDAIVFALNLNGSEPDR